MRLVAADLLQGTVVGKDALPAHNVYLALHLLRLPLGAGSLEAGAQRRGFEQLVRIFPDVSGYGLNATSYVGSLHLRELHHVGVFGYAGQVEGFLVYLLLCLPLGGYEHAPHDRGSVLSPELLIRFLSGEAPESVVGLPVVLSLEAHVFRMRGSVGIFSERADEHLPLVYVLFDPQLREGNGLGLVACYAVQPPGKQGHPLRERDFQVPHRREVLQDAATVLLPIFCALQAGDDRNGGAYAVAGRVPTHNSLAVLR